MLQKKYDKYFEKVTELQVGDIIISPLCKLCHHPLRKEAEAKWEQSKGLHGKGNCTMVIRFLNDHADEHGGIKFNHQNVSVHLNHHYEQQLKRLWLREYGKNLAAVMEERVHREEMFEALTQAMQLKLFEMAANPEVDIVRQTDAMVKMTKSILDISMVQAKLRGDIDTVDAFKEKFQHIIVQFIASETDTERQKELIRQLDLAKEEAVAES